MGPILYVVGRFYYGENSYLTRCLNQAMQGKRAHEETFPHIMMIAVEHVRHTAAYTQPGVYFAVDEQQTPYPIGHELLGSKHVLADSD